MNRIKQSRLSQACEPSFGSHFDNTRHSTRLHRDACVCRFRVCGSTTGRIYLRCCRLVRI